MSTPILEVRKLTKRFGGLVAVNGLDMQVGAGSIHGLIGPNGAGKSTAFDLISGLQRPTSGEIFIRSVASVSLTVQERVRQGICRTFQTPKLFEKMSVLDVVKTGCHVHATMGMWGSTFSVVPKRLEEDAIHSRSEALLQKVGLHTEAAELVSKLSYGKRRLVEIARALATQPAILLLDEVASGLNPVETVKISQLIKDLANEGLTIVVVEHDMPFILRMCHEVTVLNFGARIALGTPAQVASDPIVIEAYLGKAHEARVPYREQRKSL